MRRLALLSALSARAAEGQVKVVEDLDWPEAKTRRAADLLRTMGVEGKALIVLGPGDSLAARSIRNLPRANGLAVGQLSTYDVLWADTVVFTRETLPGGSS